METTMETKHTAEHAKRLDDLEAMLSDPPPQEQWDMNVWDKCALSHYSQRYCRRTRLRNYEAAAKHFGISDADSAELFDSDWNIGASPAKVLARVREVRRELRVID